MLLVVVALLAISSSVHADEDSEIVDHGEYAHDESSKRFEQAQEAVQEARAAAETAATAAKGKVEEVAAVFEPEEGKKEDAPEPKAVPESTPAKKDSPSKTTKPSPQLFKTVKSQVTSAVDKVVEKSKAALDRAKNMNKADVKKVAAAAVGVWGVAVGVGYLTTGNAK